jgi:hypothetical protein
MNIANIFGLHLGCRVKINRTGDKGKIINVSTSISNIGEGIITIEDLFSGMRTKYIKDCKLILKPLSAISEEDKAEFQKKFCESYVKVNGFFVEDGQLKMKMIDTRSLSSTAILYDNLFTRAYPTLEESLWLASKGYDIALVPDEYKEVEE